MKEYDNNELEQKPCAFYERGTDILANGIYNQISPSRTVTLVEGQAVAMEFLDEYIVLDKPEIIKKAKKKDIKKAMLDLIEDQIGLEALLDIEGVYQAVIKHYQHAVNAGIIDRHRYTEDSYVIDLEDEQSVYENIEYLWLELMKIPLENHNLTKSFFDIPEGSSIHKAINYLNDLDKEYHIEKFYLKEMYKNYLIKWGL